ncbi:hypothetical protein GOBAR_AA18983 [Gossypium barbadense]|uniref:Uncharacterized protein n=1 Tax=Gossypium barbadense TaxID=3634 RepID=A0A2P5XEA3_GOSBA|nr:hypothetical protein GOBAR_AA18983 [Gossypium barbadense]
MQTHACVKLTGLPTVSKHGRVARPCYFGRFAYGHVARLWPCLCGKPVFKSSEFILLIPAVNLIKIRFYVGIVYLKSAKLGMAYLDCTEWKNAKYRKRNFFIRFGSDNVRICGF